MLCEGVLWQIVMVRELSHLGLQTYNNANPTLGLRVRKKWKFARTIGENIQAFQMRPELANGMVGKKVSFINRPLKCS